MLRLRTENICFFRQLFKYFIDMFSYLNLFPIRWDLKKSVLELSRFYQFFEIYFL